MSQSLNFWSPQLSGSRSTAPMIIRPRGSRLGNPGMLWLLGLVALSASCGSHPSAPSAITQGAATPREVVFPSGGRDLHGYLWEPSGRGPSTTVLYNHGSEKLPG